jgi:hypothetical protein
MFRLLTGGFALALLLGSVASAAKLDDVTNWEKEANGIDMKLAVSKDTLKLSAFSGADGTIATCKMNVDKDGVVHAEVTGVEVKGNFPAAPEKGLKFSFKWKVDGKTATLSDLKGKGIEEYKDVVEGEYKKK